MQGPHPHTCPPHSTRGCCKHSIPWPPALSHSGTRICPAAQGGREAGAPGPQVSTPGVHRAGRPGPRWGGRKAGSCPAGARGTGRNPRAGTGRAHLLSAAGRGCPALQAGQGRARQGTPYLPGGSSLRRGRRPLRSVPARERPSRRPPRGNRSRSRPPPASRRHRPGTERAPAALPRGAAARSPPDYRGGSACAPRPRNPGRHARLGLPSLPAAEGPARRSRSAPAPLPRAVTRWHGRAAHPRLPRVGTGWAAPATGLAGLQAAGTRG